MYLLFRVDRAEQNVSSYRISIRGKKWWWSLFAWVLDVALQNSWILYKTFKSNNEPSLDLLNFRREVVKVYFTKYRRSSQARSSSQSSVVDHSQARRGAVLADIRYDKIGHFSESCPTTKRCAHCRKTTNRWCRKCDRGIHDRCFNEYHGFTM